CVVPEGPGEARSRSAPAGRGPRGELGGFGRGGAAGDAPSWHPRRLREAQSDDTRQAARPGAPCVFHSRIVDPRLGEEASARIDPCDLYGTGCLAREADLTPP